VGAFGEGIPGFAWCLGSGTLCFSSVPLLLPRVFEAWRPIALQVVHAYAYACMHVHACACMRMHACIHACVHACMPLGPTHSATPFIHGLNGPGRLGPAQWPFLGPAQRAGPFGPCPKDRALRAQPKGPGPLGPAQRQIGRGPMGQARWVRAQDPLCPGPSELIF